MAARILVIDDDRRITAMLRRALAYEGYEVDIASDGTKGLLIARDRPPDLVILDVMMPGLDGLEVCRRLRTGGDVPILMLTARDEVPDRVAGLDAGADDYLVKPFALEELTARVRALLRRRDGSASTVLSFGDLKLDTARREAMRGNRVIELTTKEYELLALFMRHPRQVLTRDVILEQVWGYDFGGDANVLEVYVGYLRNKLEEGGEPRLIQTVRGAGYVLREA
ncbi:MAG: response regulator transcription factor [Chloroflexi bacterium]|jgi:two-component system response regulator MprA|nr:response regulator transcription factor [Chloroflexota bacterium]HLG50199.1 response regulator transcription factor [Chloroflexota bacterium]